MFKRVLIANRGEIACRVIRTCRRLGVQSVAAYSEADADALHVRMADEAVKIGGAPASDSYLRIDRIVAAAKKVKADAVHPGYGFLSENPAFVEAVEAAKIAFVGPSASVIKQMGDKVEARGLALLADVPVIPGTDGEVSATDALAEARRVGFPLMVKAADGGGGMGIRAVEREEDLLDALEQARTQAGNFFGSDRVYLERRVDGASHVEVQILGDHHGNVVHLFERDCSVQRRNQKVIEETPCPKLTPEQREALLESAVRLAKTIGYANAGTIEYLLDRDGNFYFLEMNTRLQVEHPVTEMVTGLDLVELQLRVAAGEELPIAQEDVRARGAAIEARIYPEDPVSPAAHLRRGGAPAGAQGRRRAPRLRPLRGLRGVALLRADDGQTHRLGRTTAPPPSTACARRWTSSTPRGWSTTPPSSAASSTAPFSPRRATTTPSSKSCCAPPPPTPAARS